MPPPQKDSVHRYFTYNKANNSSQCNLCNRNIKGKHTSNLKNHLATKHFAEFQIVKELNQINTPKTNDSLEIREITFNLNDPIEIQKTTLNSNSNDPLEIRKRTLNSNSIDPLEIRKTTINNSNSNNLPNPLIERLKKICVRLVTEHGRPIGMIEDEAFQELLSLACPKGLTNQIHVEAIKNTVHEQADLIRNEIWSEIKNKLVTIKLDSVTCVKRKFLGFNIQYIKNGRIVVRNLAVYEVKEPQTGSFLKSVLNEVLTEFGISSENIYCICIDNGANMMKTVKLVGGKYFIESEKNRAHDNEEESDEEEIELLEEALNDNYDGSEEDRSNNIFSTEQDFNVPDLVSLTDFNIRGMLCAAHTLQLAIRDAIAENTTVEFILNIARTIVHTLRRPNNAHALESTHLRKAIIDCPTRWTSTYNMLEVLLTLRDFIVTIQDVSSLVSPAFWTQLVVVIECLQPANEATIKLQKQDLTIGDFYIVWANCKNEISAIDHEFAIGIIQCMEARENKLLNNDVVLEALYIDRRLNVILNDQQCERAKSLLKETYQQLQNLNQTKDNVAVNQQNNDDTSMPSTSQGMLSLEALLMKAETARGSSRQQKSLDFCLNELVVAPRLPINESILNHWNNAAVLSSDFAMLANTVLATPSTQVSVERLFSSLKFMLDPLRSNLCQRLLRDIMLVRQNKDLFKQDRDIL